ncbi:MAG: hypothetical protein IKU72_00720 [Oscillospiraceae bacterium]|nr:hypothetical protein [Oscillospiraceae bacterium]
MKKLLIVLIIAVLVLGAVDFFTRDRANPYPEDADNWDTPSDVSEPSEWELFAERAAEESQPEEPEIKYPVVNEFPTSIDEFEWEDYLAHMQQLKGLSESDLRSLNNMGFSRQDILNMTDQEAQEYLEQWKANAEKRAAEEGNSEDTNPPLGFTFEYGTIGEAMEIHAGLVKEFKYEIIDVTEGKQLTLYNSDAANAAMGLLESKISIYNPQQDEIDVVTGGEYRRFTLTLLSGDFISIEDNGMVSFNIRSELYFWDKKEEITLPENAVWTEYTITPFDGEENPIT